MPCLDGTNWCSCSCSLAGRLALVLDGTPPPPRRGQRVTDVVDLDIIFVMAMKCRRERFGKYICLLFVRWNAQYGHCSDLYSAVEVVVPYVYAFHPSIPRPIPLGDVFGFIYPV